MNIDLRQLRYFVAVAEEQSFSRAAERLFLTQPPLSQQIRRLEEALGTPLFERTTRAVTLTQAGVVLLDSAKPLLEQAQRAVEDVRGTARGERGPLRIGFVGSAIHGAFARVLVAFRSTYPLLELELLEMSAKEQHEALKTKRLHVSLGRVPPADPSLRAVVVEEEPLVLAVPEETRRRAESAIEVAALGHETWIIFPRPLAPALYDEIVTCWHRAGIAPRTFEAANMQTILGLVSAGIGVAFVLASMRRLRYEGVVYHEVNPAPTSLLYLTWLASEAHAAIRELPTFFERAQPHDAGGD